MAICDLDDELLVLQKDGTFSMIITVDEINNINNILDGILAGEKLTGSSQRQIIKAQKILQNKNGGIKRFKLEDILKKYGKKSRVSGIESERYRSDAFKIYYNYFLYMNRKKVVLLQRSHNDKTLYIYDDDLVFRIHLGYTWQMEDIIKSFKIYRIDNDTNSRTPLMTFIGKSTPLMRYIKQPLIEIFNDISNEVYQYKNNTTVYNSKRTTTPPIQDIFDIINSLGDEYVYFQYGGGKIKSTSSELLVTLKMI